MTGNDYTPAWGVKMKLFESYYLKQGHFGMAEDISLYPKAKWGEEEEHLPCQALFMVSFKYGIIGRRFKGELATY